MRKSFLKSGAALFAAAILSVPLARGEEDYEKQLRHVYPTATFKVTGDTMVNNIKVRTIQITTKTGAEATARVTETGDLIMTTVPRTVAEMPAGVALVTTRLFGTPPTRVDASTLTEYVVHVTAEGAGYDLKVNAAGLIVGVDTNQELSMEDPHRAPKVGGADSAAISKIAMERFPGAKVTSINKSTSAAGFYVVEFTEGNESGWAILSEDNRERSHSIRIPEGQAPAAVLAAVAEVKGAKVDAVSRYTYNVWDVTEDVKGDMISMKVRPDGSVLSVESREAKAMHEQIKAAMKK